MGREDKSELFSRDAMESGLQAVGQGADRGDMDRVTLNGPVIVVRVI